MRRILCASLVACSTPSEPPRVAQTFVVASNDAESLRFGAVHVAKPRVLARLASGRHGLQITSLATDGVAAVSLDEERHARLWPSLDGTREPWALPLSQPVRTAVQHGADGFAVAALDSSGGLEVLAIGDDGRVASHVRVDSELAYDSLISIDDGFLAVRADHAIEWLDRLGTRRAILVAQPGEAIVRLLHAESRTLVLVNTREGLRGRWLAGAGNALAWGGETAVLPIDPSTASLSPDHEHVLARSRSHSDEEVEPMLIELEHGRAREIHDAFSGVPPAGIPLGFASAERVVFAEPNFEVSSFQWWNSERGRIAKIGGSPHYELDRVAVTDGIVAGNRVIAFSGRDLVIADEYGVKHLGYRQDAISVRGTPTGVVAAVGGAVLLDDQLHVKQHLPGLDTIVIDGDIALVRFAGDIDQDWLAMKRTLGLETTRSEMTRIALYDLAHRRELQTFPVGTFRYDPATRLLAIARGSKLVVAELDPATRRFGPTTTLAIPPIRELVLLDPALAGGNVAITLYRGEARVWRDLHTVPSPIRLADRVEAIDRAGRIYVRESPSVISAGSSFRIENAAELHIRPSPDARHVAAFGANRVMLFDDRGTEVWSVALPGVRDVVWSPRGELIAQARDLAQLSLADGTLAGAQCGWSFALRDHIVDHATRGSTLCDR